MLRTLLIPTFAALLAFPQLAQAAFVINIDQVGSDVTAVGSGSLITSSLFRANGDGTSGPSILPSTSDVIFGPLGINPNMVYSAVFVGPSSLGSGALQRPTSSSGSAIAFLPRLSLLYVPISYVSDSQLSASMTFANQTLASLGLTPGTYNYSYRAQAGGAFIDTITIRVGAGGTVPEPASIAMVALGLAGVGVIARRRG